MEIKTENTIRVTVDPCMPACFYECSGNVHKTKIPYLELPERGMCFLAFDVMGMGCVTLKPGFQWHSAIHLLDKRACVIRSCLPDNRVNRPIEFSEYQVRKICVPLFTWSEHETLFDSEEKSDVYLELVSENNRISESGRCSIRNECLLFVNSSDLPSE